MSYTQHKSQQSEEKVGPRKVFFNPLHLWAGTCLEYWQIGSENQDSRPVFFNFSTPGFGLWIGT